MKKYLRLTCSVCQRFTDKLVDDTHFTPDKCTITLKCTGRLSPVEYRSNANVISTPVAGVTDWRPRGEVSSVGTAASAALVNTATGSTKQVVLAARISSPPAPGSTLVLKFNERADTPSAYRQYVFRFDTTFTTVSGVESGLEKKTLRYTSTDTVEVYLNGVLQVNGTGPTEYILGDGSGPGLANAVTFNTAVSLPGITQVDVIVSEASSTVQVPVTFTRNQNDESRQGTGAYENIDFAQLFVGGAWVPFYLFTLDLEDAGLALNTIITPDTKAKLNGLYDILSSEIYVLLAREPYSQLDRYSTLAVKLSDLSFDEQYLKFYLDAGSKRLDLTSSTVKSVYPPIRFELFNAESLISTNLPGVTDQIVLDDSVVVGPDA